MQPNPNGEPASSEDLRGRRTGHFLPKASSSSELALRRVRSLLQLRRPAIPTVWVGLVESQVGGLPESPADSSSAMRCASTVDVPGRRPESTSAWFTHCRNDSVPTPSPSRRGSPRRGVRRSARGSPAPSAPPAHASPRGTSAAYAAGLCCSCSILTSKVWSLRGSQAVHTTPQADDHLTATPQPTPAAEDNQQLLSVLIDISWPTDRQPLSELTHKRCRISSAKPRKE